MKVPFNSLKRGFELYKTEYEEKAVEILNSGWYILGNEVENFEIEFASKLGARFAVGVDNGLNAISLGIKALGIGTGDEVILQANTYIATVLGVSHNGATPIFVEPDAFFGIDVKKIEEKITKRTKAILITHLYGQASNMDTINEICSKYNIVLLEDCAQSHFAKYNNQNTGTFGKLGFFSFYPTKNLGAFGDGGAIVTDDCMLAEKIRALRNYGSKEKYINKYIGFNCRLDEMQAGLLRVKLKHIDELNNQRANIAKRYLSEIKNEKVILPKVRENSTHTWHLFVVCCEKRDALREYLSENGIQTDMHYPVPPHLSQAYKHLGYMKGDFPVAEHYANTVLSLPLFNGMTEDELDRVIESINRF